MWADVGEVKRVDIDVVFAMSINRAMRWACGAQLFLAEYTVQDR